MSRTQAIRPLFFEIADSWALSHTRKSNFLRVLHFWGYFRARPGRVRDPMDLDMGIAPGPPPTMQICYYLLHFGESGAPELKRYAPWWPRTQAIRMFFWASSRIRKNAVNSMQIVHRELQESSDTLVVCPECKPYGFFFLEMLTV